MTEFKIRSKPGLILFESLSIENDDEVKINVQIEVLRISGKMLFRKNYTDWHRKNINDIFLIIDKPGKYTIFDLALCLRETCLDISLETNPSNVYNLTLKTK